MQVGHKKRMFYLMKLKRYRLYRNQRDRSMMKLFCYLLTSKVNSKLSPFFAIIQSIPFTEIIFLDAKASTASTDGTKTFLVLTVLTGSTGSLFKEAVSGASFPWSRR